MYPGDRVRFPSCSEFGAPKNMGACLDTRQDFLYEGKMASARVFKAHVIQESWNGGSSPLQSSWIQRLMPAPGSVGGGSLKSTDVHRTLDHGPSNLDSNENMFPALASHETPISESREEGLRAKLPAYENSRTRLFAPSDGKGKQVTCSQEPVRGIGERSYEALEKLDTVQPKVRVNPIPLPNVESLLPGYSGKIDERANAPFESTNTSRVPSSSRPSFEKTPRVPFPLNIKPTGFGSSKAGKESSMQRFNSVPTAGKVTGFGSLRVAVDRSKPTQSGANALPEAAAPMSTKTSAPSCGWRERFKMAGMGKNVGRSGPPEARFVSARETPCNFNYIQRVATGASRMPFKAIDLEGQAELSPNNSCERREHFFSGSGERKFSSGSKLPLRPVKPKGPDSKVSETDYLCSLKFHSFYGYNENLQQQFDKRPSAFDADGSVQCMAEHSLLHDADSSTIRAGIQLAEPFVADVTPQQDVSTSRKVLDEQPSRSFERSFKLERRSDAETGKGEWPPALAPLTNEQSWHYGSSSGTPSFPQENFAGSFQTKKCIYKHTTTAIADKEYQGQDGSLFESRQPWICASETDSLLEGDSASPWPRKDGLRMEDGSPFEATCNDIGAIFSFKSKGDNIYGCEVKTGCLKGHKPSLSQELAVFSKGECETLSQRVEDQEHRNGFSVGRNSNYSNLLAVSSLKSSRKGVGYLGSKSTGINRFKHHLQRLSYSAPSVASLEMLDHEVEIHHGDHCINADGSIKVSVNVAVGPSGLLASSETGRHAGRHSNSISDEQQVNSASILGKRHWDCFEGKQFLRPMHKVTPGRMELGSPVGGIELEGSCSKPKMWLQRWSMSASTTNCKDSSVLGRKLTETAGPNVSAHCTFPSRACENFDTKHRDAENCDRRGNEHCGTSRNFSGYGSEAAERGLHANRRASQFRKRFVPPSAAAMAIMGTTARQIHVTQPQKKGLFSVWTSPKAPTVQTQESQKESYKEKETLPEPNKKIVQAVVEYPIMNTQALS